jgi:predicted peptidase
MTSSALNNILPSGFDMKNHFLLVLLCAAFTYPARSQEFAAYQKKIFSRDGDTLPYRILYPAHYDPHKNYPLIIFLHGSGQRGHDNENQLIHGGHFFLEDSLRNQFPSIVIFPQCAANTGWSYFGFVFDTVKRTVNLSFTFQKKPGKYALLVKELADSLVTAGLINTRQMYIGGLSLGGFGTYDFIERYPGYFAAAFPICGGGDTSRAPTIAGRTAVWIFHGSADPLVNVRYAQQYFRSLKRANADVKYTEYPGVKHNSWDNAFNEPGLMEWLFSKKSGK